MMDRTFPSLLLGLLVLTLFVLFIGCDTLEDLVNDEVDISQEIIGTWVLTKFSNEYSDCPDKNDSGSVTDPAEIEFTGAGEFIQRMDLGDGWLTDEGTYTVSGDALEISIGSTYSILTATIEGSTLRTTDVDYTDSCGRVTVTRTYRKK